MIQASPLLTNAEAAVWLRLCKQEAMPDEIAKAIRKLHGLVRAGKLRPLASSKPYTFSVAELQRYVDADTVAFGVATEKETKLIAGD